MNNHFQSSATRTNAKKLQIIKVHSDTITHTNCVAVNGKEFSPDVKYVEIYSGNRWIPFKLYLDEKVSIGCIAFSLPQRKWAVLAVEDFVAVKPFFPNKMEYLFSLKLILDFWAKKVATNSNQSIDSDELAKAFITQFSALVLSKGQQFVFSVPSFKLFSLTVKELEVSDIKSLDSISKCRKAHCGVIMPNTIVIFEKSEGGTFILTGKAKELTSNQSIINPDWNFQKMGIGGLDKEFSAIFRRAFASRVFPPEVIEQLGAKHVKGILLFGPPGTGKTLMARQIGKMLNAREPKIVNGPEILNKFVGESEANIRKLFADAEEEEKRLGSLSGLHIIIFDEIDAICKSRGSVQGGTNVHDTVVNQLLSKIDGVDQLNNILVIGMTNRKDMIDEALLRPGRLEVQMEIGLPSESGRLQILKIHTSKMRENDKFDKDIDLAECASLMKNFSGAEIEGAVRAAQSSALNRLVKATSKVEVDVNKFDEIKITKADFIYALENDIKPAFGSNCEQIENFISNGIITWSPYVTDILEEGELFVQQVSNSSNKCLISMLLEGPPGSGKTALAAQIAKKSDIPFVKICTPQDMVGFSESAKALIVKKVFEDAYKSEMSCVIVDELERLLDYGPIGPKYSNVMLQTLHILLKKEPPKKHKLFIIATTSQVGLIRELELDSIFTSICHVHNISNSHHLINALEGMSTFTSEELENISSKTKNKKCWIGVKKLFLLNELAKQVDSEFRIPKFLSKLEEEGGLEM